jgi:hypothetical protein
MFAEEESAVALFGELAGGFGDVLAVGAVLSATWKAFGSGLEQEHNRGVLYGLFWQVTGHADQDPKYWEDDPNPFGEKLPWDSFDEMKQAFQDGVAEGRQSANDPKTFNRVAAAIAWQMKAQGQDMDTAASLVMNEVWHKATGGTKPEFIDYP